MKLTRTDLYESLKFFNTLEKFCKFSLSLWVPTTIWGFIVDSRPLTAFGMLFMISALIFIMLLELEQEDLRWKIERWNEEKED